MDQFRASIIRLFPIPSKFSRVLTAISKAVNSAFIKLILLGRVRFFKLQTREFQYQKENGNLTLLEPIITKPVRKLIKKLFYQYMLCCHL